MIGRKFNFIFTAILFLGLTSFTSGIQTRQSQVLVIGGTTGGISAGIQSARLNVPTLIVEETPWLGGMITAAGVSATDGNHELYSGIWEEFRVKLRAHYGGAAAMATGWVSYTQFEPHVGDQIFKAMAAAEPNLTVIYGFHLVEILKKGDQVIGAIFENQQKERLKVSAKVVIDATDLGDGLAMAGAKYDLGMEARSVTGEDCAPENANDIIQDLTWTAILKDFGKGTDKTIAQPRNYNPDLYKGACTAESDNMVNDCQKMLDYGRLPNNKFMINWPNKGNDIYLNVVEMEWSHRQEALQQAKDKTLGFVYYIQTELGFKHIGLAEDEFPTADHLALVPYHREGRRLRGVTRLTITHILNRDKGDLLYRTGISVGDYPVDHHHGENRAAPKINFPAVPSFNIPLGTLIPEQVNGLIVADKAISVSNIINGATRLQPCVMLTGQAAGALAALSVKNNQQVREINIHKIQQLLLDANAYLMPLIDVTPKDKEFQAIQRVTVSGILKVQGESFQWANRTWFYPDSTITVKEFSQGLKAFDPIAELDNDPSTLTLHKASALFSKFLKRDVTGEIQQIWTGRISRKYDQHLALTKRELSVLADELIRPFDTRTIGMEGNYR